MSSVKSIYSLLGASWYNPFKKLWNLFTQEAESRLGLFLKRNSKGSDILELGCGTGLNLNRILKTRFRSYLGVDFTPAMLRFAERFKDPRVKFQRADITKLKIRKKFDIILCTWVLSHIKYPSDVVNKVQSLLKPKGKIFLVFFTKPKWYINFWMFPLARYLFRSEYVSDEEISRFRNVKNVHRYAAGMATVVEIGSR